MENRTKTIRIIGTSDLHGRMVGWDYALNASSPDGSAAKLASALKEYRNENTLLVDAGDTVQDNSAELFIGEGVHPMIQAVNAMNYDVCVTGNHDYDYGMDVLKQIISDLNAKVLTGNVHRKDGTPLADGYTIFTIDGVRIAVIGMVTPIIARTSAQQLKGWVVTDPLEETRKIIDQLKGSYDVLIGVFHLGVKRENGLVNSGMDDILVHCPEFDAVLSSHEHKAIPELYINDVLVMQNRSRACTMAVIDLMLEEDENGWHVIKRVPQLVELAPFEEDSSMRKLLEPYHRMALEDAGKVIGMLVGEALAPKGKGGELPPFLTQDTPLLNLYQSMMLYYSGARVSAIPMSNEYADLQPGEIHKSDIALLFRYLNYLYTLKMSGSQLKQFMEWSAGFFEFWTEGTVVQKSNNLPLYNYHMFGGVRYDVNLAEPVGSRIENLIWQDTGLPVKPEDVFDIAVTDYAARSYLLIPGIIYDEGDLPTLKQQNVYADIGPIRDLLMDFIVNVKNGVLEPYCSDSWKVVTRKRCKKRAFFRR